MDKNNNTYTIYANVAYTWYKGNSNLKQATKIAMGCLILIYTIALIIIYYSLKNNNLFFTFFIISTLFLSATFLFFFKELYKIIMVCKEMESQGKYWRDNSLLKVLPELIGEKEKIIFCAVNDVIKENLTIKK